MRGCLTWGAADTGPRTRFRYHILSAFPIPGPSTVFRIPCPVGASHTSPGCKPWESPRQKNPRSEGTPHKHACPGHRLLPSLCGVPSEHTYSLNAVPRVGTLGWYAMPLQGMGFETRFDIEVERYPTGLKRRSVRRSVGRSARRSVGRSVPRPGSATHGYRKFRPRFLLRFPCLVGQSVRAVRLAGNELIPPAGTCG